jgi:hypothetical protein
MLKQKQLAALLLGLALAPTAIAQPNDAQTKSVAPAAIAQPKSVAPDAATQARMKEAEDKLARAAEEEAKRAAVLKAYEEEQAERQKQLAKEKEERCAARPRLLRGPVPVQAGDDRRGHRPLPLDP